MYRSIGMKWDAMNAQYTMIDKFKLKGANTMKTTKWQSHGKSMIESYNQAIQRPLFIEQTPKGSTWLDVAIAVSVGLMLAIGALSYFDVLTK
jgi:hypothetical protein